MGQLDYVVNCIISANKDRATEVEASFYMHEKIKNSELVVLAPSGYVSMMEQHQQFDEAVISFVRRYSQQNLTVS